jgi:hypothetical protein
LGFLAAFRRRSTITTLPALTDFIDGNAAFLVQKGLYEYSRARAGHYAKILFTETEFRQTIERSRWQAFPLGLAMVTEMVEGVLRKYADDRRALLNNLAALTLSVFDRYDVPAALKPLQWTQARQDLMHRIDLIGIHAVKAAKDIPIPCAKAYFDLMPIHEKLRTGEFPTITNYLRVSMCNIHDEFTKRMDARALAQALSST